MADEGDARFTRNEQGDVVLIRGDERTVLGPLGSVGDEMCRFLAEVDYGDCPPASPSLLEAPAPEIVRARAAAAHYEREQGREDAAEAIESGEADDSALMRAMLWLWEGRT